MKPKYKYGQRFKYTSDFYGETRARLVNIEERKVRDEMNLVHSKFLYSVEVTPEGDFWPLDDKVTMDEETVEKYVSGSL